MKAATGQNVSAIRKMAKSNPKGAVDLEKAAANLTDVGSKLLTPDENGQQVVGWLDRAESIAPKASERKNAIGEQIGNVGKQIDEATPEGAISGWNIAKDMQSYADSIPGTEAGKNLKKRIQAEADNIKGMGNLTFDEAHALPKISLITSTALQIF